MSDKFVKKIEENPFVYHYTSIEALFAILEGYRQKKCFGLPFRAHCIYNVNDKREMELGYETVKKILPQYEASQPNSKHLSDVYQKAEYEKKCIEQFSEKPSDGQINMGNVPYTISFSCKRDFLPMWSMYGNDKKGACLNINLYRLIDTNHSQECFVYYDGDEDNLIKAYFLPLLYEFFISSQNNPMSIEDKIKAYDELYASIDALGDDTLSQAFEQAYGQ